MRNAFTVALVIFLAPLLVMLTEFYLRGICGSAWALPTSTACYANEGAAAASTAVATWLLILATGAGALATFFAVVVAQRGAAPTARQR